MNTLKFILIVCFFVILSYTHVDGKQRSGSMTPEKEIQTTKKVVSLEFFYKGSGMMRYGDYRYHLREQDDGSVLFDAHTYVGRNVTVITLKNALISREDIDALVEILGGYSALDKLRNINKNSAFTAKENDLRTDGPHYSEMLEIILADRTELVKAPPNDNRKLILFNYLKMLAIRLALPPAEGDIFSFTFYGRDDSGNYHYELLERNDKITLYAVYGDKRLVGLTPTREDLQALQAICDSYALAGAQQTYRPSLPSDFEPDKHKERYTYIEMNWANGAVLNANTAFGGEDALKTFFFELAARLENQQES